MKKLFTVLAIALCVASGYAQKNEYILQKTGNEIKLILKSNYVPTEVIGNIQVDNELVEKYGESRILQAWQKDTVCVGADWFWEQSCFGLKLQRTTKTIFLVRQDNEIVEYISLPTTEEWKIWWIYVVSFLVGLLISILLFRDNLWCAIPAGIIAALFLIGVLLLFMFFSSNDIWLPLVIAIICFVVGIAVGILLRYLYKRTKSRKDTKSEFEEEKEE